MTVCGKLLPAILLLIASPTLAGTPACPGDCNDSQDVAVDEVLLGIGIGLGDFTLDVCEAFDIDENLVVTVEELTAGTRALLRGCGEVSPSPTPTPTGTPGAVPEWETLEPLPGPRQESGVAELDGRIYVLGGFNADGIPVNTVEYYDPIANEWTPVAPLPRALHHVTAAAVGGRVYAIGGLLTLAFTAVNDVYAYDPEANQWLPRAGLSAARGAAAAAVIDGLIYVAGGYRNGRSVTDFAVYDPVANEWTELPTMPTARDHLAAGAIDGIFYATGGRSGRLFGELEAYDPEQRIWTTLAPMPTARAGLAAAVLDGLLYTFGGEGNPEDPQGIFPQTEAYDPTTNTWSPLPDMLTPRHGMGAAAFGDRIIVPGGATEQGFDASNANEALRP